jgi:hypothetical protein
MNRNQEVPLWGTALSGVSSMGVKKIGVSNYRGIKNEPTEFQNGTEWL